MDKKKCTFTRIESGVQKEPRTMSRSVNIYVRRRQEMVKSPLESFSKLNYFPFIKLHLLIYYCSKKKCMPLKERRIRDINIKSVRRIRHPPSISEMPSKLHRDDKLQTELSLSPYAEVQSRVQSSYFQMPNCYEGQG